MIRIGFINYLNCLPLRLGLEATGGLEGIELIGGTPADSNAALLSGEVEVGLVSSASWARNRDRLQRVQGYGITSDGSVMSVLLATRKNQPLSDAQRVALTSESATSHSLAEIVLERVYGASPRYEVVSMPPEWALAEYDAALFIGDKALGVRCLGGVEVYDLGEAWERFTGLPMVYAIWASRGDPARYGFWADRVAQAVDWAEKHLDAVVEEARRRGAPATDEDLRTYFTSCIAYQIGEREEEGLKRYLAEGGFLASKFYDGRVSA
ncbi:MAG: menaquinone biosynthesis protein [Rubrobacter sp.]|nr:menaquinone biosynthesis protein [Rubrobacter sp.]